MISLQSLDELLCDRRRSFSCELYGCSDNAGKQGVRETYKISLDRIKWLIPHRFHERSIEGSKLPSRSSRDPRWNVFEPGEVFSPYSPQQPTMCYGFHGCLRQSNIRVIGVTYTHAKCNIHDDSCKSPVIDNEAGITRPKTAIPTG